MLKKKLQIFFSLTISFGGVGNHLKHVEIQKKKFKYFSNKIEIFLKKVAKFPVFFFSIFLFLVGNQLKHVEMQKKNSNIFFKMAAIAAILDFDQVQNLMA